MYVVLFTLPLSKLLAIETDSTQLSVNENVFIPSHAGGTQKMQGLPLKHLRGR